MRIIAGQYARRNLFTLNSNKTRPTGDKTKESLFNSLGQFFSGGRVLDLYAGSGALGIESVSRGMDEAYLVDIAPDAIQIIKRNVALTKEEEKFKVIKRPDTMALAQFAQEQVQFDLIFLDPPYAKQKIAQIIQQMLELDLLADDALIVAETDEKTELEDVAGVSLIKTLNYSHTTVRIYQKD